MVRDHEAEQRVAESLSHWPQLTLGTRVAEGDRSQVWRGRLHGQPVSIRRSRRSGASLEWELDLLDHLDAAGVAVPVAIRTADGQRQANGVVVQPWIEGREPDSEADWRAVADTLRTVHRAGAQVRQRPACCTVAELRSARRSVDADLDALPDELADELCAIFEDFADVATSLIHGDPHAGNIRITPAGTVALLDFDESRIDLVWHDLSGLGVQVLDDADHARALRLSDAWETVNAWVAEPNYAQRRLESLRSR